MSIENSARTFFSTLWGAYQRRKQTFRAVHEAKTCAFMPTYYPEGEQKTKEQRIRENIEWARKYGEPNRFYTLYGLDQVGSHPEEYMDYLNFMTSRNIVNRYKELDSQLVILRDKYMFYKYMKACNLPVPEVFAIWKNGQLYNVDFEPIAWETLECRSDYFLKSIDGECASFVKHIVDFQELMQIKDTFEQTGAYIFQERVIQSKEMNVINTDAINTYRIVTVNKDGNPYVLTSILRVGTKKTGNVDNWAAGGLAIGIQNNGFLKEFGYFKPAYGTKTDVHPDTGIRFCEFQAPEYNRAIDLACRAHRHLYGIRAIGWDVAVSENGPCFIEGNDNWEISLNQACDRPLRREWEQVIR